MNYDIINSPEKLRSVPLTNPEKNRCATVDKAVKNISFALRGVEQQELRRIAEQQKASRQSQEQANYLQYKTLPETPQQVMSELADSNYEDKIINTNNELTARQAVEEALQ